MNSSFDKQHFIGEQKEKSSWNFRTIYHKWFLEERLKNKINSMLMTKPCILESSCFVSVPLQGSNLALANLLNASSFLQKASRNCHHLLFLSCGNKSLSYQPNYATHHMLYGKLADQDLHCYQGNLNIGSKS